MFISCQRLRRNTRREWLACVATQWARIWAAESEPIRVYISLSCFKYLFPYSAYWTILHPFDSRYCFNFGFLSVISTAPYWCHWIWHDLHSGFTLCGRSPPPEPTDLICDGSILSLAPQQQHGICLIDRINSGFMTLVFFSNTCVELYIYIFFRIRVNLLKGCALDYAIVYR